MHHTYPKPERGTARLERLGKKRSRKLAEERAMSAARRRDGHRCRWPRCEFTGLTLAVAHLEHRGMGGNPAGDKTERHKLILLCVRHHDRFDGRAAPDVDIVPVDSRAGTDGPCVFYVRGESGRLEHVATERWIGVSVSRGPR